MPSTPADGRACGEPGSRAAGRRRSPGTSSRRTHYRLTACWPRALSMTPSAEGQGSGSWIWRNPAHRPTWCSSPHRSDGCRFCAVQTDPSSSPPPPTHSGVLTNWFEELVDAECRQPVYSREFDAGETAAPRRMKSTVPPGSGIRAKPITSPEEAAFGARCPIAQCGRTRQPAIVGDASDDAVHRRPGQRGELSVRGHDESLPPAAGAPLDTPPAWAYFDNGLQLGSSIRRQTGSYSCASATADSLGTRPCPPRS